MVRSRKYLCLWHFEWVHSRLYLQWSGLMWCGGRGGKISGVSGRSGSPGSWLAAAHVFFRVCPELGCRPLHGCLVLLVSLSVCQSQCPWGVASVSSSSAPQRCGWRAEASWVHTCSRVGFWGPSWVQDHKAEAAERIRRASPAALIPFFRYDVSWWDIRKNWLWWKTRFHSELETIPVSIRISKYRFPWNESIWLSYSQTAPELFSDSPWPCTWGERLSCPAGWPNTSLFRFSGVTGDSILLLVKDRCHELDLPLEFCLGIL